MVSITPTLKSIIESGTYQPVLILEIEGLPTTASASVNKVLRFDDVDFNFDDLRSFDTPISNNHILKLIDLKSSSDSITQNLPIDSGGESSAQTFNVALVDKQGIVTEWITPGLVIDDILGKKAKIYFNAVGGLHPEDSILIMSGLVDGYISGPASISASVTSAEQYKRSDLLPQTATKILQYPDFSTTLAANSINKQPFTLVDASGFPDPANGFSLSRTNKRYLIRIDGTDIFSYSAVNYSTNILTYQLPGEVVTNHGSYTAGMTVELYQMTGANYIELTNAASMLLPSSDGVLSTYVKIEDEIIQYTALGYGGITGLTRGCFGTAHVEHPFGSDVTTLYQLTGSMKDLALKVMLSGAENPFFYEGSCDLVTSNGTTIANTIFVNDPRFFESGVRVGDKANLLNASGITAYSNCVITALGSTSTNPYVTVSTSLAAAENFTIQVKSKYNTLPTYAGLEMTPDQVDIDEHELIDTTYSGQLLEYDFRFTDKIKGTDLINKQIYFSNGAFSIVRKGKASIGITAPPLAINNTQTLDSSNVIQASQIRISRSLNKYFYNAVTYKYDPLVTDNSTYTRNNLYLSASSTERIKVPTKALNIQADGVRYDSNSDFLVETVCKKILDRYQFGAESFQVQVKYSLGMQIENGDSVIFDGAGLSLSDTKNGNGTRNFKPRIMSVVNKQVKPWKNQVVLTLVDTSFTVNGRYGVLSPSSDLFTGSTTTKLSVTPGDELKWADYIGQYAMVRNDDWTDAEEQIVSRIDDGAVFLDSPLSFVPTDGYILDTAPYPNNTNPDDHKLIKGRHCFLNPQVDVVSSSAADRFTVSSGDISKFIVGAFVSVHDDDYTNISDDMVIKQISGNTVILSESMGFTPTSSFVVDLIGFKDGGLPYRWI